MSDKRALDLRSYAIPGLGFLLVLIVYCGRFAGDPAAVDPAALLTELEGLKSQGAYGLLLMHSGGAFVKLANTALSHDLPLLLESQLRTAGRLALYSLIPAFAGLVFRRSFARWFLGSFLLLVAGDWLNWTLRGEAIGSGLLAQLVLPHRLYLVLEAVLVVLLLSFRLRFHKPRRVDRKKGPERNVVVCLDGTWNHPGQTDYGLESRTNVLKLFQVLKGGAPSKAYNANLAKEYDEKQIAFYYHGVGNKLENSSLGQVFGGAFGLGAQAIKERAYLDVARAYSAGARIYIFGFSRGAAIARLLAGVLGKRGIPKSIWTLRLLGRHWPVWLSRERLPGVKVEVLGCWDTVGSFGIAKDLFGIPFRAMTNLLRNLSVALCVKRAYHLVALDETRDSFEPTLMDPDPTNLDRIVEVWFSGNHSNVGGGFARDGLAELTLDFMLKLVSSGYSIDPTKPGDETWGLYLDARRRPPPPKGSTHQGDAGNNEVDRDQYAQLRHSTGPIFTHQPRRLPEGALIYDGVFARLQSTKCRYAPESLFRLNEHLAQKRRDIGQTADSLYDTGSVDKRLKDNLKKWKDRELKVQRWTRSHFKHLDPASELDNRSSP